MDKLLNSTFLEKQMYIVGWENYVEFEYEKLKALSGGEEK